MNKRGLLFAILILGFILLCGFTSAATNTTSESDAVAKAYTCLSSKIDKLSDVTSLQDAVFSELALGSVAKLDSAIANQKSATQECWPSGACKVKDTAQVMLVYNRLGRGTADIKTYLDTRTIKANGLDWYLQLDIPSKQQSRCTIGVDNDEKVITIGEDQIITGSAGTCFSLGGNGYWLKIKSTCFNKDISISCDKDFVSALVYERTNSDVVFIAGDSHASAASGITTENVNSNCFEINGKCDYESTLWGVLAYKKIGADVSSYMPYLLALSDDNIKYFPEAFLYMATGADGYYSSIVQSQQNEQYWDITASPYGKFYDTALAILALSSGTASEADSAKNYLLSIQGSDGCWQNMNLRDTAFVLYAGWMRDVSGSKESCLAANHFCEITTDCTDAGGDILADYSCADFGKFCCSVKVPLKSCSVLGGKLCSADETCSGTDLQSIEGDCCMGTCSAKQQQSACEQYSGACRTSCLSGEGQVGYACTDQTQVCCIASTGGGLGLVGWALIFGILIILVVLGIVFRQKLRIWWLTIKGRLITSQIFKRVGGKGEAAGAQRMPPRYPPSGPSYAPRSVERRAPSDMNETLRKLREMTK